MSVKHCPNCGSEIPADNRFCGNCGARADTVAPAATAAKTMFFGASQPSGRAKLTVIKGEGVDGVTYLLNATDHTAGRTEGRDHVPGRSAALAAAREFHLSGRQALRRGRGLRERRLHSHQSARHPRPRARYS